jgi:hypothetical protein
VAKKSAKRGVAKKKSASRGPAIKRRVAKKQRKSTSPLARVKRVAQEVAQQATTAVTEGVETLKDFGESIVERVTS